MDKHTTISIPQFGVSGAKHFNIVMSQKELDDLKIWMKHKREEILNDCINNPNKYMRDVR